jgi:hypothetical protein
MQSIASPLHLPHSIFTVAICKTRGLSVLKSPTLSVPMMTAPEGIVDGAALYIQSFLSDLRTTPTASASSPFLVPAVDKGMNTKTHNVGTPEACSDSSP